MIFTAARRVASLRVASLRFATEERAGHMVVKAALQLGLLAKRPRVRINLTQIVIRKHNALSEQELMEAIVDRLATK